MVTVTACIQQIPPDNSGLHVLDVDEITQTGEDYLTAVAAAEAKVPDGWRVLYVRALEEEPAEVQEPDSA